MPVLPSPTDAADAQTPRSVESSDEQVSSRPPEAEPPAGEHPRQLGPAFWRKRLARALVAGALVLGLAQFLPHLPEDQSVVFVAPQGSVLAGLEVDYFDDAEQLMLATRLAPVDPAPSLAHNARLPSGEYRIQLRASILTEGRHEERLESQSLRLEGHSHRIFVTPPSRSPR